MDSRFGITHKLRALTDDVRRQAPRVGRTSLQLLRSRQQALHLSPARMHGHQQSTYMLCWSINDTTDAVSCIAVATAISGLRQDHTWQTSAVLLLCLPHLLWPRLQAAQHPVPGAVDHSACSRAPCAATKSQGEATSSLVKERQRWLWCDMQHMSRAWAACLLSICIEAYALDVQSCCTPFCSCGPLAGVA